MSELFVDSLGDGTPVVLVHGSLATGAEAWEAQRPLADEGFRLLVVDRRGCGQSPVAEGEDFLRDADDIADVMGNGAHLVGHSYGGLGVLFAAARRPDATRSLALLEPPAFTLGQGHPAVRTLVDEVRSIWDDQDLPDDEWVVGFLKAVGSDPDEFPPGVPRHRFAARTRAPPRAAGLVRRATPVRRGGDFVPQARRVRRSQRRLRCCVRRAGGTDRRVPRGGGGCRSRDAIHRKAHQRGAARPVAHRLIVTEHVS